MDAARKEIVFRCVTVRAGLSIATPLARHRYFAQARIQRL
jgi:hypothetical protein